MSTQPPTLQPRNFGQHKPLTGRVIRPRKVGFTNLATDVFPASSPETLRDSPLPKIDRDARLEPALDRRNSIPRAWPIPGLLVKRIMDLSLSAVALLLLW